ncbi:MAG TPA: hypothetical protein VGB69_10690 [Edaphobacter sp.]
MLFLGKRSTTGQGIGLSQLPAMQDSELSWGEVSYRPSGEVTPETEVEITTGRRGCGNPQCASSWTAPWRSRKRPIFEGQWGCGGRCVLEMVRTSMRRESSDGILDAPTQHRHRVPLGLLMHSQGWLTHPQLQKALEIQKERGGRIGEILVAECGVDSDLITRGLGMQWSRPVLSAGGFSPRLMALVAPRPFLAQSGLLPLRVAGSSILYVGFEDRLDASSVLALERMSGLKVESGVVKTGEYEEAKAALLENAAVDLKEEILGDVDAVAARVTAVLEQKQPVASKLVRFHRHYWLRLWLEAKAGGGQGVLPVHAEDVFDYVFTAGRLA